MNARQIPVIVSFYDCTVVRTLRKVAVSELALLLTWWHVSIVVPTLLFKVWYVRWTYGYFWSKPYNIGTSALISSMGDTPVQQYVNLALLFSIEFFEVWLLIGVLFGVKRVLLRSDCKAFIVGSVCLCMLIIGASYLSARELDTLLAFDTLTISAIWANNNPQIIGYFLTGPVISFIGFAILWSFLPVLLSSRSIVANQLRPWKERCERFVLLISAIGFVLGCLGWLQVARTDISPSLRGYWSSTIISFFDLESTHLSTDALPTPGKIEGAYQSLVYPTESDAEASPRIVISRERLRRRHIVIVVLETAPKKYYPLVDNSSLTTFFKISRKAIISDSHYAISPYTVWNYASMISGNYLTPDVAPTHKHSKPDSLASILTPFGYETTFLDSYLFKGESNPQFLNLLGFTNVLDTSKDEIAFNRSSYATTVNKERQSFHRALTRITDAGQRGKRAFVVIATTVGHFPWATESPRPRRSNKEKIYGIAKLFDNLLGNFLQSLAKEGLSNEVIIVVTGDHGLRYRLEFESLGETVEHGDAAFNVPFILYGPGIFDGQIRLPYATSHVDIAPTLLALNGIERRSWLHHGDSMLRINLRDRITFMMNTRLSPVDGFHWKGCHYTFNNLTGQVRRRTRPTTTRPAMSSADRCIGSRATLTDAQVASILKEGRKVFRSTVSHFNRRKASNAS